MRFSILFLLALLLATPLARADYTVPREIEPLLADALSAASPNRNIALKYLRYHLPADIEALKPHLAELEAIYPTLPENSDTRSSLAITLLGLGSQLDATDLRLTGLRESDSYAKVPELTTAGLLKGLNAPTDAVNANRILSGMMKHDTHMHWAGDFDALTAFITTGTSLLAQTTEGDRADLLAKLVRYRMKLLGYFDNYKKQEAQSAGFITIYDKHTETEVSSLLAQLDKTICTYPPQAGETKWTYTFIPHKAIFETDTPINLTCGG